MTGGPSESAPFVEKTIWSSPLLHVSSLPFDERQKYSCKTDD